MMIYGDWVAGAFLPDMSFITIDSERADGGPTVAKIIERSGVNRARRLPDREAKDPDFCKGIQNQMDEEERMRKERYQMDSFLKKIREELKIDVDEPGSNSLDEEIRTAHILKGKIDNWKDPEGKPEIREAVQEFNRLSGIASKIQAAIDAGVYSHLEGKLNQAQKEIDKAMKAAREIIEGIIPEIPTGQPAPSQKSEQELIGEYLAQQPQTPAHVEEYFNTQKPPIHINDKVKIRDTVDRTRHPGEEGWVVGFTEDIGMNMAIVAFIDDEAIVDTVEYQYRHFTPI